MNTLVREASTQCLDLTSWLAPKPNDMIMVATGIADASGLVLTELLFKGFTIVNQTAEVQARLPRSVARSVFLAALVALTDAATAPANIVLDAELVDSELVLAISVHPGQAELVLGGAPPYRNIEWEDVQALADVESVRIVKTSGRVELHCPVTVSTV